jgi:hypothetical protein
MARGCEHREQCKPRRSQSGRGGTAIGFDTEATEGH